MALELLSGILHRGSIFQRYEEHGLKNVRSLRSRKDLGPSQTVCFRFQRDYKKTKLFNFKV